MVLKLTRPPAIAEFMAEWREDITCDAPFSRERTFGLCLLEVEDFAGTVWLKSIRSITPRQGCGSRAVEALCVLADRHHLPIILHPKPFGPSPSMSARQLTQWYSRFGFKLMRNGSMRRVPQPIKGEIN